VKQIDYKAAVAVARVVVHIHRLVVVVDHQVADLAVDPVVDPVVEVAVVVEVEVEEEISNPIIKLWYMIIYFLFFGEGRNGHSSAKGGSI
jgi:hypothetical protein